MNKRKLRQKEKKRLALNEERMAGRVYGIYGLSDSTARKALNHIKTKKAVS